MVREGSGQPARPTTRAGTPATVTLFGTDLSSTEPDLGMAVAGFLTGAAERHVVQDRYVVFDQCGLTHHDAGGVVEKNATTDARGGVNVALERR